jgi:hypothetical protein
LPLRIEGKSALLTLCVGTTDFGGACTRTGARFDRDLLFFFFLGKKGKRKPIQEQSPCDQPKGFHQKNLKKPPIEQVKKVQRQFWNKKIDASVADMPCGSTHHETQDRSFVADCAHQHSVHAGRQSFQ